MAEEGDADYEGRDDDYEGSDDDIEYGGFDVKFLDTCLLERECPICHLAYRDPVQTTCGHIFCKTCITKVIRLTPRCPLDNIFIDRDEKLLQDIAFLRKFMNPSEIMCSNGCEWTGCYRDFVENHHLSTCGFVVTKCMNTNCKETFLKKFSEEHKSGCPWQVIKCIYCEDDDIIRKDKQSHEEQCIKFPVQCTKCLCKEFPRQMLKEHIDNECVKTKINCPYALSGCDFIVERDMMETHVKEQVSKHLLLVQETYKKEIKQAREEIVKLQEEKDKQQQQIVQLKWNLKSQKWDEPIANFWEIPGISDILETEQYLWSDTFYTEPGLDFGYRFQLRFKSKNYSKRGKAKKTNPFIGLHFHLISGDHDDALTWPFEENYTLSIVNQAGHHDLKITMKPEEESEDVIKNCFLKPVKSEPNSGWGNNCLILQKDLTTWGFIRNDRLLIKCAWQGDCSW